MENHWKSLENRWRSWKKPWKTHGFFHENFGIPAIFPQHATARHAPGRGASWRPPSHHCESRVFLEFHPRWTHILYIYIYIDIDIDTDIDKDRQIDLIILD